MERREFVAATAAMLVWPGRLRAQGARRRLGFLAVGDGSGQSLNPAELVFFDALRSLGGVEGKSLAIEPNLRIDCQRLSPTSLLLIRMCSLLRDHKRPWP
jgi:putative tryptophan/tyrosine transport system substrate-binding protein